MSAMFTPMIAPAPMPCKARAQAKAGKVLARQQASDAAVTKDTPNRNTLRGPRESPSAANGSNHRELVGVDNPD